MSSKSQKDGQKTAKNQFVASRCVAVVFKRKEKVDSSADCETFENCHTEEQCCDKDSNHLTFHGKLTASKDVFDAKQVFAEFKLRNKTSYWNPALVDSVDNLEYAGFIEPFTILVKGDDIHLGNIRTAWGRRVLKDPTNYQIVRIGDVNGIEMHVIPQSQFIPLPEALCLLIMDLNNSQVVATLDTICERLKSCYQGLQLPGSQHVYDTLGQLIRERKVFHTGCGYFVVTPDTFRMQGDEIQTGSLLSPWTHLHPMYIPAAFSQQKRQPMRSISCQVDPEDEAVYQPERSDTVRKNSNSCEKLQIELPSPRVNRSMSLSVRRPRDRGRRDEVSEIGSTRRSSSVKGRNEKSKTLTKEEYKKENKSGKSKEKLSLFARIFGKNKKKQVPVENEKAPVEYATFSAQFPPPEWTWYQQQLDRQLRTETWVQQQMIKSGTWHYLQSMTGGSPSTSLCMGANSLPDRTTTGPSSHNLLSLNQNLDSGVSRRSNKKSHKHKDRTSVVIANNPEETTHVDIDQKKHTYRNSLGQANIRLSSLPTRVSPLNETVHSNYNSHPPMFSSTPRFSAIPEGQRVREVDSAGLDGGIKNTQFKYEKDQSKSLKKSHKSKRKSGNPDRHSSYLPLSRHISGMSARTAAEIDQDISFEYQGQLPNKYSSLGKSHSSGVNCIGLDTEPVQISKPVLTSPQYQRSNSYRHTVTSGHPDTGQGQRKDLRYQRSYSYRHTVKDSDFNHRGENTGHIYANVHISEQMKPQIPERLHGGSRDCRDQSREMCSFRDFRDEQAEEVDCASGSLTHYRTELPESDRHSDHGSDHGHSEHTSSSGGGTLTSTSSQEPASQDSAVEGTESSEHSTVIDTRLIASKHMERLTAEAKELTLGDSGFSSPRVSENSNDSKVGGKNLTKGQKSFMCNNLRENQKLNNSLGQLDECSDDSFDRISSDRLYENVRLSHREVLNNMKFLHKEINVSSQNLNRQTVQSDSLPASFDPKQSVAKKFSFEGDFHVVGVV